MDNDLRILRPQTGLYERRLIRRGDIKGFWNDLHDFHIRGSLSDPIGTIGSALMGAAVAVTKFPNALIGELSDAAPVQLRNGPLKYIERDMRSATKNLLGGIGDVLTLHPIRAATKFLKGAFDAVDLVAVDPILDIASSAFGHINRDARSSAHQILDS